MPIRIAMVCKMLKLSRLELYRLVWRQPIKTIAAAYGVDAIRLATHVIGLIFLIRAPAIGKGLTSGSGWKNLL
ncbi:hypothetical protein ACRYWZ_14355 [Agrobacterium deltaense]|uniref:hypothetical protein n=1 Tax=Agrobacterium deltaense TaxID=1183412 RepID=UPI003D97711A